MKLVLLGPWATVLWLSLTGYLEVRMMFVGELVPGMGPSNC
jgi:hypothetical protein